MLFRINLFISSYLPLYLLLIYKGYSEWANAKPGEINQIVFLWFLAVLIIFSLIAIGTIAYFCFKKTNRSEKIKGKFTTTGDNVISYIMTYLIPMLSMELKDTTSILINLSIFLIIGVLYVRNNLVYLNPVLSMLGFYVFE